LGVTFTNLSGLGGVHLFLDGLFKILSDKEEDIHKQAAACLTGFLGEIEKSSMKWKVHTPLSCQNLLTSPLAPRSARELPTVVLLHLSDRFLSCHK
jgi:hypothetical protein